MHVGIVNWSLYRGRGGIERNANLLAGTLAKRGHKVTVFYQLGDDAGGRPVYAIPPGVRTAALELDDRFPEPERARSALLESGIDILVTMFSWESQIWFPWLLKGSGIPLVISERSTPDNTIRSWNAVERSACLELADHIHLLTREFAHSVPEDLRERVTVLPNPVDVTHFAGPQVVKPERDVLLALGRFEESTKQFSHLIRAFGLLAEEFPDWTLRLCGNGDSFKHYAALRQELGLGERIELPGMIEDVAGEYSRASFFCLPSRVEGFPTVGLEAQYFGLPIVGYAQCPGLNELVIHGENGVLVRDMTPEDLARGLKTLMRDPELREKMALRSKELLQRYDPASIYDAWENMLQHAIDTAHPPRMERVAQGLEGSEAAREVIGRIHAFDRSAYLRIHATACKTGEQSPFTDVQIRKFISQMERFCLPGYRLSRKCIKNRLMKLVRKKHTLAASRG